MAYEPFKNVKRVNAASYNPFANAKRIPQRQLAANQAAGMATNFIGKALTGDAFMDFVKGGPSEMMKISKKNQAIGEGALGAVNSGLLGIPKMGLVEAAKRMEIDLPEPKSPIAENVGGALGLMAGPGQLAVKGVRMIKPLAGRGVAKAIGRGTLEGAATGFAAAPVKREDFLNPKQRAINAGVGAAAGAGGELAVRGVKNVAMVATPKGRTELVNRTRDAFRATKAQKGQQFEATIDSLTKQNPNNLVDLDGAVQQLEIDITNNPKLASAVNRTPRLKRLMQMQPGTRKISLKEAQDIKNELSSKISASKLAGNGVRPDDMDLLNTVDDIRDAQLSAFPDSQFAEYGKARKEYGDMIGDYKIIRGKIREGGLEKNIYNKFGGDIEAENAVRNLLPKENLKEVAAARMANKFLKNAPMAAGLGGGGYILAENVLRPIFEKMRKD